MTNLHHDEIEFAEGVVVLAQQVARGIGVAENHPHNCMIARVHDAQRRDGDGRVIFEQFEQLEQLANLVVEKHRELPDGRW